MLSPNTLCKSGVKNLLQSLECSSSHRGSCAPLAKTLCTNSKDWLNLRVCMNSLPSLFLRVVFASVLAILIVGCLTTTPTNPPGVIQVWAEPPNVRLIRNGVTVSVIHPKLPNVEAWRIVYNQSAIVIKSRGLKSQPAAIELFDVNTGALIDSVMTYSLYTGQPAWARGFGE